MLIFTEQGILNSFSYTNSDYGLRNIDIAFVKGSRVSVNNEGTEITSFN